MALKILSENLSNCNNLQEVDTDKCNKNTLTAGVSSTKEMQNGLFNIEGMHLFTQIKHLTKYGQQRCLATTIPAYASLIMKGSNFRDHIVEILIGVFSKY